MDQPPPGGIFLILDKTELGQLLAHVHKVIFKCLAVHAIQKLVKVELT
jgi:hypothetical protein